MTRRRTLPVALTVAGSDSGGGAGVPGDLKTFAAMGVHGTCAITCVTAQNPARVVAVEPCTPRMLQRQLEAVFAELPPVAAKTGMLYSAANIRVTARFFAAQRRVPLVVDPVIVSTSGARLLEPAAEKVMLATLLPLAALVTPNVAEAAILSGHGIQTVEELRQAARAIFSRFGCAVLAKGGHLPQSREAADIFYDGKTELLLSAPRVRGIFTHGTGCTYSAAITAALAQGCDLADAVEVGKAFITSAIGGSYRVGPYYALDQMGAGQRSRSGAKAHAR